MPENCLNDFKIYVWAGVFSAKYSCESALQTAWLRVIPHSVGHNVTGNNMFADQNPTALAPESHDFTAGPAQTYDYKSISNSPTADVSLPRPPVQQPLLAAHPTTMVTSTTIPQVLTDNMIMITLHTLAPMVNPLIFTVVPDSQHEPRHWRIHYWLWCLPSCYRRSRSLCALQHWSWIRTPTLYTTNKILKPLETIQFRSTGFEMVFSPLFLFSFFLNVLRESTHPYGCFLMINTFCVSLFLWFQLFTSLSCA